MIRLRRWLPVIAAMVLLAGGSAVLTAGPASAQPNIQICSNVAPNLCANADGGFHSPGDAVILFRNGDPNNTFSIVHLTGICNAGGGVGAGYVHNGEGGEICPFPNGSGLNNRYDKDAIVEFQDYTSALVYDPPLCIADGSGSGSSVLQGCSWIQNNFGFGGARGSVFILSHITDVNNMGTTPFFAVNYYYTTLGVCGLNQPAWMIGGSLAVPIYLNICKALHEWSQILALASAGSPPSTRRGASAAFSGWPGFSMNVTAPPDFWGCCHNHGKRHRGIGTCRYLDGAALMRY